MQCDDAAGNIVTAVVCSARGNPDALCHEMGSMFKGWKVTRRENIVLRLAMDRMRTIAQLRQSELEAQVWCVEGGRGMV